MAKRKRSELSRHKDRIRKWIKRHEKKGEFIDEKYQSLSQFSLEELRELTAKKLKQEVEIYANKIKNDYSAYLDDKYYGEQFDMVSSAIEDFIYSLTPKPIDPKYAGTKYYRNFNEIYNQQVKVANFAEIKWNEIKTNRESIKELSGKTEELSTLLATIKYDSDSSNVQSAVNRVISILSISPLSIEENSSISMVDEYYEDFEDGDDEGFY